MMMLVVDLCVVLSSTLTMTIMFATFWSIFDKAGQPGWAAVVPPYSFVVFIKVCGKPVWWILLFMIPCIGPVFQILLTLELAKRFGKGGGFIAGLILLPYLFFPILAFGKSEYTVPEVATA